MKEQEANPNSRQPRRATLSNIRSFFGDNDEAERARVREIEVSVLLVSLKLLNTERETVLARNPTWERLIKVPDLKPGDYLMISTSNGGTIELSSSLIEEKAYDNQEFDAHITGVPLASSLRIRLEPDVSYIDSASASTIYKNTKDPKSKATSILVSLFSDRESFLIVLLSTLVVTIIAISVGNLLENQDALLVSSISTLLATVTTYQILKKYWRKEDPSISYNLYINAHIFTSPEAPVGTEEDMIPQRFINGCKKGNNDAKEDLKEARRRWDLTREWRERERVYQVTDEKQPYFEIIKENYPFYWAGRGKEGHLVFYERPGELNRKVLIEANGLNVNHMVRHYLYVTEYQWKYLAPDEMAKTISVIDMSKVTYSSLNGEPYKFLNSSLKIANAHYPERSHVIYIVNSPSWFSMLWKMIKGFVHENTQKKVRICSASETLDSMMEHIDKSQIPEYYGGDLRFDPPPGYNGPDRSEAKESCRFFSPEVLGMAEYTRRLNEGTQDSDEKMEGAESNKHEHHPPGTPGEMHQGMNGHNINHHNGHNINHHNDAYNSPANGSTMSTLTPPSAHNNNIRNGLGAGTGARLMNSNVRHYGDDDYSIISSSTVTR